MIEQTVRKIEIPNSCVQIGHFASAKLQNISAPGSHISKPATKIKTRDFKMVENENNLLSK